jgi:hypothetical protein
MSNIFEQVGHLGGKTIIIKTRRLTLVPTWSDTSASVRECKSTGKWAIDAQCYPYQLQFCGCSLRRGKNCEKSDEENRSSHTVRTKGQETCPFLSSWGASGDGHAVLPVLGSPHILSRGSDHCRSSREVGLRRTTHSAMAEAVRLVAAVDVVAFASKHQPAGRVALSAEGSGGIGVAAAAAGDNAAVVGLVARRCQWRGRRGRRWSAYGRGPAVSVSARHPAWREAPAKLREGTQGSCVGAHGGARGNG